MNWLINTLVSSIGKKLLMAVTGLGFISFLAGHLIGNLTIYGGKEAFNSYADHLHSLGPLITLAEVGLLTFAFIHIGTGLLLFYQNWKARPVRYAVKKNAGGRTLGSGTMPYTGLIILLFVIVHLLDFHFVDKSDTTIFEIVSLSFEEMARVLFYIAAVAVVAVHVSHGFWSAFQTLGLNHPKYLPPIQQFGLLFSIALGVGFGFIPIIITLLA